MSETIKVMITAKEVLYYSVMVDMTEEEYGLLSKMDTDDVRESRSEYKILKSHLVGNKFYKDGFENVYIKLIEDSKNEREFK